MTGKTTIKSFDAALLAVSHFLTEAGVAAEQGDLPRSEALYAVAEHCAVGAGYLELLHLVWSFDNAPPPVAFAARQRRSLASAE